MLLLEIAHDSYDLWKKMIAISILIDKPMPIKVIAKQSCSIIADDNPVDIDHRHQNP